MISFTPIKINNLIHSLLLERLLTGEIELISTIISHGCIRPLNVPVTAMERLIFVD